MNTVRYAGEANPYLANAYESSVLTMCISIQSCALVSERSICWAARDHVHERTSTTQPSRLQEFVRAVGEIRIGSRLIQSTRGGLCEPLNLDTVCVSSLRVALEVTGSSDSLSQALGRPKEPGDDELYCMSDSLHVQCGGRPR